jgi:hypothetical protein
MNGEIERNQWLSFLNDFSKRNEGLPARIEVVGEEIGAQEAGRHLPLVGVSFEAKGSEEGDVVVTFAGQTTADVRHFTRRIDSVTRIAARTGEQREGEEDEALEIESADGTKTILVFEQLPALPPANS